MAARPRHLPELDSTSYTAHRLVCASIFTSAGIDVHHSTMRQLPIYISRAGECTNLLTPVL